MSQSDYPEYITKQDILKFVDLAVNESDDPYEACLLISNYLKEEFNKKSDIKYINDTTVVYLDPKNLKLEDKGIYIVPNIADNYLNTGFSNKIVIQSGQI